MNICKFVSIYSMLTNKNKNMEDFKQLFTNIINFGWKDSNYFEHLVKVANDSNKLAKLKCKVEKLSFNKCISQHDAMWSLISNGKI